MTGNRCSTRCSGRPRRRRPRRRPRRPRRSAVTGTHTRAGNAMSRTRAALLAGAAAAVEASGTKITMAQVATAAGVAKATLYNHFRTREAVLGRAAARPGARRRRRAGRQALDGALADAAVAMSGNPVRRGLARVEPATLAALGRIDAVGRRPGSTPARRVAAALACRGPRRHRHRAALAGVLPAHPGRRGEPSPPTSRPSWSPALTRRPQAVGLRPARPGRSHACGSDGACRRRLSSALDRDPAAIAGLEDQRADSTAAAGRAHGRPGRGGPGPAASRRRSLPRARAEIAAALRAADRAAGRPASRTADRRRRPVRRRPPRRCAPRCGVLGAASLTSWRRCAARARATSNRARGVLRETRQTSTRPCASSAAAARVRARRAGAADRGGPARGHATPGALGRAAPAGSAGTSRCCGPAAARPGRRGWIGVRQRRHGWPPRS